MEKQNGGKKHEKERNKNVLELHKKWMNSEGGGQLRSALALL